MSLLGWSKFYPDEINLKTLIPGDLKVLILLASHMDMDDILCTTYKSIALNCLLTRRYTIARIKNLAKLQLLEHRCTGDRQMLLWIKKGFSHRKDNMRNNPPSAWTNMFLKDKLIDFETRKNSLKE